MLLRVPFHSFPIEIREVVMGAEHKKILEDGKTVKCWMCGSPFIANSDTVYTIDGSLDEVPYVRCPVCNSRASAVYYAERKRPVRVRNREVMVIENV